MKCLFTTCEGKQQALGRPGSSATLTGLQSPCNRKVTVYSSGCHKTFKWRNTLYFLISIICIQTRRVSRFWVEARQSNFLTAALKPRAITTPGWGLELGSMFAKQQDALRENWAWCRLPLMPTLGRRKQSDGENPLGKTKQLSKKWNIKRAIICDNDDRFQ